MADDKDTVYGIDLGTTNSEIAVYRNDEVTVFKNAEGSEVTPSAVFFTGVDGDGNDETLVGQEAKNAAKADPDHVVQFIKRRMGHHGDAYNFLDAPSGKAYTPEMISALILKKVCQGAELEDGEGAVKNVVITVPAYFDDARRTATKQAGKIAGFNVLRVLNEPTAAAIAFGMGSSEGGKTLVYDLGGGTFDVTIMDITPTDGGGDFNVLATDGDHELGGINFDQKLLALICDKLADQGCTVDDENDALMADLREKAETTKKQLSNIEKARPRFTVDKKTYTVEVTQDEFEQAAEDLMRRTELLVNNTLETAHLTWVQIDHLIMVGGSTRMPMVKKLLERISGKEVLRTVDPDTAVAQGAAIFGSTLDAGSADGGGPAMQIGGGDDSKIKVSDVTSQSLGVITMVPGTEKRINSIIIPHNTKIPAKMSGDFSTRYDNQTSIKVQVTEGDDTDVEFVTIIGSSVLSIPPYPADSPIEIIYAYDVDQTVSIEVIDKVTNKSLGTFDIDRSDNLSTEEVSDAAKVVGRLQID